MSSEYLIEIRKLSLTARSAVALLVVEEYLRFKDLATNDTAEYLNYLWEWPIIEDFELWEKNRPFLVNYALGDKPSSSLESDLHSKKIDERVFRQVVSGPVEILWGSFWGAAEDNRSYEELERTIRASNSEKLPVLTPFKFSLFESGDGWGKPVSKQDRDYWRENASYA